MKGGVPHCVRTFRPACGCSLTAILVYFAEFKTYNVFFCNAVTITHLVPEAEHIELLTCAV